MSGALARRLIPDHLWTVAEPLIPQPRVRPQGGGRSRVDDRAVFTAMAFVLSSNCPWRAIPKVFQVKAPTVHRRFGEWLAIDLWQRLYENCVVIFGEGPEVEWTLALAQAANARGRMDAVRPPTGRTIEPADPPVTCPVEAPETDAPHGMFKAHRPAGRQPAIGPVRRRSAARNPLIGTPGAGGRAIEPPPISPMSVQGQPGSVH